ncbi:hypothetical protein LX36DRAFT_659346 [Colletotrichum falcatum]|nr:hypothetical protein LX36DRAFT_659346 [Colletotrichum falcatum]
MLALLCLACLCHGTRRAGAHALAGCLPAPQVAAGCLGTYRTERNTDAYRPVLYGIQEIAGQGRTGQSRTGESSTKEQGLGPLGGVVRIRTLPWNSRPALQMVV